MVNPSQDVHSINCNYSLLYLVWYLIVLYCVVWYGLVWYGVVWCGMVSYGLVLCGVVWYLMVCYGLCQTWKQGTDWTIWRRPELELVMIISCMPPPYAPPSAPPAKSRSLRLQ